VLVPCFLLFLCFGKATGNILGIGRNKSRTSYFFRTRVRVQSRDGGGPGPGHTLGRRGPGLGRATRGDPPGPLPDAAPPPIYSPRQENPKGMITFPETYREPPSSSTRYREGPEALPGTLPERGIATGGLLRHHACLGSDA
jgi:hypothetical protein